MSKRIDLVGLTNEQLVSETFLEHASAARKELCRRLAQKDAALQQARLALFGSCTAELLDEIEAALSLTRNEKVTP